MNYSLLIKLFAFFTLASFTLSSESLAAKFANRFIEFDLPANWDCILEGSEWVCQNKTEAEKKRDAIVVLAAKIQGEQDSLEQYQNYLKTPKQYQNTKGEPITSQVRYTQNLTIGDQNWIDSLQLDSEVPGFLTRYLATVKDGIGILVTYSVNKNKYPEYQSLFDSMVKTIKVFRMEGGLNAAPATSDLFKNSKIPSALSSESVFGGATDVQAQTQAAQKSEWEALLEDPMILYGGLGVAAILLLSILRKRKKS